MKLPLVSVAQDPTQTLSTIYKSLQWNYPFKIYIKWCDKLGNTVYNQESVAKI